MGLVATSYVTKAVQDKIEYPLTTGIHLVIVDLIRFARTGNGELIKTAKGEHAIEIIFSNAESKKISLMIWLNQANQWIIDKFCIAIGVNNKNDSIPVEKTYGKRLFIFVKEIHYYNDDGEEVNLEYAVIPDFSPCINEGNPPARIGNPAKNNGVASGVFLENKKISERF